ncbi:hypothetical protein [Psychrobacter sp. 16-MNA-CIBAN-0192]|uniref:hypothetical protein n=1 Tax=Psychrobacter sp. 16-MNA-CIBAN-0192 TaxID=3140448 RepID=UPI00332FB967
MKKSTNNQQPLKGSRKLLKKSIFLLLKAFKIIYSLLRVFDLIKHYFDGNP